MIALDRDPAAPGFRYADRRAIISTEDEPRISRLAEAERIDGVIAPGIDWPVAIAARVAERQGLSHPISGVVASLATSKLKQRERLGEAGVPQPRWQIVTEPNETAEVPSVVKAPTGRARRGCPWSERPESCGGARTRSPSPGAGSPSSRSSSRGLR